MGSPWRAAVELLPNPAQHRPSPSLASELEQCSELGKMGRRAWYTPGLLHLLHLPAFSQSPSFSLFLLFFSRWHSLSSAQASFLFLFLWFSVSWGEPANLSIPQCH